MRSRHLTPLLAAVAVTGLLAASKPASAGHVDFSVGATFPVGHGVVSLMIGQPAYGYQYRYPTYGRSWEAQPFYYRVAAPIHIHDARCSSRCYIRGGYEYHHPSCQSLHAYFDSYNVHPSGYWPYSSWAPDWNQYGWRTPAYRMPRYNGSYGYRTYGGRYDGRHDGRYDGRHDGRYDGRSTRRYVRPHDPRDSDRRHDGRSSDPRWRERDRNRDRDRDGGRDRDWRDRD